MISEVSDTSLWVAHYRAQETERSDALFEDRLAGKLAGEKGRLISDELPGLSEQVRYHVITRTVAIDRFIQSLVSAGVDTVLNLGCGLDTRPYRLDLPKTTKWIEVDYPHIVEHKNRVLANETPNISLERVGLDLADRGKRQQLFLRVSSSSKNALVLTEGVIGYLTEEQVGELADDLAAQNNFRYWITEYNSPLSYRFMKNSKHNRAMKNAPFQFMPKDWFGFFEKHGWQKQRLTYLADIAQEHSRPVPMPSIAKLALPLMPAFIKNMAREALGYVVFEPKK